MFKCKIYLDHWVLKGALVEFRVDEIAVNVVSWERRDIILSSGSKFLEVILYLWCCDMPILDLEAVR